MTKPVLTGKRAKEVYDGIVKIAHEGRLEALDGLYLMLGDDMKAAIQNQRDIIERFELIEQAMMKMSDLQIHAAAKLFKGVTEE